MPPRRKPVGAGLNLKDILAKARNVARSTGAVSKGLRAVSSHTKRPALVNKIADLAHSEGYGRRRIAGRAPGWNKFKTGVKKVAKFVKDNKLISKGLSAAAPFLGPYSGIATTVSGVANSLGAGISLPGPHGGSRHHRNHPFHHHPYRNPHGGVLGNSRGGGLLLAGERAGPRRRIVRPDAYETQ